MAEPLHIDRNGHRTWLKWHRARRKPSDPAFTGARILEAMRLGASVEVDLVVTADKGFAVLHDLALDHETTGTGLVAATGDAVIRQLHLRGNNGVPLADRVMLLDDLCALIEEGQVHPDALLQLDYKEDLAALDPKTVTNFARNVGPHAGNMIVSGGDLPAVLCLAEATPGLRVGYDPCYGESLARLQASLDYDAFTSEALRAAPQAAFIYLHHEIVLAADRAGYDMIAAIHADNRQVDAWTIREVTPASIAQVERLLALKVDQITTDDPEGLYAALTS